MTFNLFYSKTAAKKKNTPVAAFKKPVRGTLALQVRLVMKKCVSTLFNNYNQLRSIN